MDMLPDTMILFFGSVPENKRTPFFDLPFFACWQLPYLTGSESELARLLT
jgi:hypothetical protein